jgi:hypothetical protein
LKNPLGIDAASLKYSFCAAKAGWYPEIIDVFEQCRVAYLTGILPQSGGLDDQPALFAMVFPAFVDRFRARTYARIWEDVSDYSQQILNAIFGKKK